MRINKEVRLPSGLCLQWITELFVDGPVDSYRFAWRGDSGHYRRGSPRIGSVSDMQDLLDLALRSGWLGAVEREEETLLSRVYRIKKTTSKNNANEE